MPDTLMRVLDELRELRREVRRQGATLELVLDALRTQGLRVSTLERAHLTPVPVAEEDD